MQGLESPFTTRRSLSHIEDAKHPYMLRVVVHPPLVCSDDQQRDVAEQEGHVLAPDLDQVCPPVLVLGLKGAQVIQRWVEKKLMDTCRYVCAPKHMILPTKDAQAMAHLWCVLRC